MGFDDTSLASYPRPALTSVSLPAYELGATALRLLLDDDPHPTPQMLPTRLVVRESCAAPPARAG